ncbi:hypothetical protein KC332_g12160 [Hortaea werneckii]|nr:hypothetical protein KC350_g5277 [Hortaea werneckii]KAI6848101.1 hypothetical protein KC358_g1982 [Hortaea werneckii]KAI6936544.1 hypothetical protein KC348_g5973 [Hortaea werneckii]KAI6942104.1 hypothetical protein KC341_g2450 [Hortaea werneckii]KAI6973432.1 hypothetical protein KC321_g5666 [Hortaea werneckii]
MFFDILPNEIVTHVFHSLPDVSSVLALASTCHHFHDVYQKQKLSILTQAADAELGPIDDIVQIVTQNTSQPAHIQRNVPMSDALLKDVWRVGKVAQQWEDVYPFKKWKNDYSARRLLTPAERYTLRRAIYRVWLFSAAFHTRQYIRTSRNLPHIMHERALLLHNFSTVELSEMLDVHGILKDVIANNICPSNGKVRQKFHKRYPESNHQLLFNIHLNYPPPPTPSWQAAAGDGWFNSSLITSAKYHQTHLSRLQPSRFHEPGSEGWGDDISHFYVVEDMSKLDPGQILFLKNRAPLKQQVDMWLRTSLEGGVEWFVNNGETFSETLGFVIRQRGGDMEALRGAVAEGEMGIAVLEAEM